MEQLRQRGLFISILHQGSINTKLARIISEMEQHEGYRITREYASDKPITNNRNKIAQRFLNNKECDYLMMIDSDIVPPANILNLIDFQKDIITPLMFVHQKGRLIPLALKRAKDGIMGVDYFLDKSGLLEVDATGTGCIIIKREVLEQLRHPFRNEYDADGVKSKGQDISFCQRAKELGFKSYVHLDYIASHFTEYDVKDLFYIMVNKQKTKEELNLFKKLLKEKDEKLYDLINEEIIKKASAPINSDGVSPE